MTASITNRKASRRERKGAKELLRVGLKVWLYKKDCLSPIEQRGLSIANQSLKEALRTKNITAQELESDLALIRAVEPQAKETQNETGTIERQLDIDKRQGSQEEVSEQGYCF